jgi:hypothetical protein
MFFDAKSFLREDAGKPFVCKRSPSRVEKRKYPRVGADVFFEREGFTYERLKKT